ncbi:MAG: PelD GGDEF domain-containing protein [Burkholderiaceae bacterium]
MARAEPLAANPIASRFFAPIVRDWERPLTILRILAENILLIGSTLLISRWLSPDDPFGIEQQFPWLWLVPMLLALRYGTIDGVLGAGFILGSWLLPQPWGMTGGVVEPVFPQEFFLGGLVLVLISGQFADVWNGRLSRIRAANAYLDERLISLTRTHYLIRLSHQRLEQELLVRPVMLSDLLTELRPVTPEDAGELANADVLLRMLASSCELEGASMHKYAHDKLEGPGIANIGEAIDLNQDDPLVRMAMESRKLMHVQASDASLYESDYLICAPVIASSGDQLGVLVVREMPFFALNEENLQFITVLLGYYADGLAKSRAIHPIQTLRPNAPPEFALELVRMKRLFDSSHIDSSMIGFSFDVDHNGKAMFEHLRRIKRATDIAWELETPNRHVLILMMPMSGPPAVEGMLQRMEKAIRQQFDLSFDEARISVHSAGMSAAEPEWVLDDLLNRCGVEQQLYGQVAI